MVDIDIQEVINHIDELIQSTHSDMVVMEDNPEVIEFYRGMLFGYDELKDFLNFRKGVEELR